MRETSSSVPGSKIADGVWMFSSLHLCIEVLNSELVGSVRSWAFGEREDCRVRAVWRAASLVETMVLVFFFDLSSWLLFFGF
jgi:hypothetical protein